MAERPKAGEGSQQPRPPQGVRATSTRNRIHDRCFAIAMIAEGLTIVAETLHSSHQQTLVSVKGPSQVAAFFPRAAYVKDDEQMT